MSKDLQSGTQVHFNYRELSYEINIHNAKHDWPALFQDLWFTFAIFKSRS